MNQNSIASEIGFSDGEVLSYKRVGDHLDISVKAWNERYIGLRFKDVASFSDWGAAEISDVIKLTGPTPFLEQAMKRLYESPPANHEYHHYQFLDLSGGPIIDIVAVSVQVI